MIIRCYVCEISEWQLFFVVGWLYHGPITTLMEDMCVCVLVIDQALAGASQQDRPDLSTAEWMPFLIFPEKTHLDRFSLPQTLFKGCLLYIKIRNQWFSSFYWCTGIHWESIWWFYYSYLQEIQIHLSLFNSVKFHPFPQKKKYVAALCSFHFLFCDMLFSKLVCWLCTVQHGLSRTGGPGLFFVWVTFAN